MVEAFLFFFLNVVSDWERSSFDMKTGYYRRVLIVANIDPACVNRTILRFPRLFVKEKFCRCLPTMYNLIEWDVCFSCLFDVANYGMSVFHVIPYHMVPYNHILHV